MAVNSQHSQQHAVKLKVNEKVNYLQNNNKFVQRSKFQKSQLAQHINEHLYGAIYQFYFLCTEQ